MSLWAATARQSPPFAPKLMGSARADVAIVGASYTGLSAALALAEGGASVFVLEAREIGFGASGRNGGQVIPGLKLDPDELDRRFGAATTAFAGAAADVAFAMIARLGIDCGAVRSGWIQGSLKTAHLDAVAARAEQWRRRGAPVETPDAAAMTRLTGARGFVGGWRDGRAGVLHPLDFARGLAKSAQGAGARLHADTPVARLERAGGRWRLSAPSGAIEADAVVLATNGYSDRLWPGLRATILPARSCQIATAPLSPDVRTQILPGGEAVSDTRRIGNYFRLGPGGRLLMGGRGAFRETPKARDFSRLRAALAQFFPEAAGAAVEHGWSGRVAMTPDHLPHVHQPAPNLTLALGYNGRGVAMATAFGLAVGAHLIDPSKPLPLRVSALKALPLHGLHPLYDAGAIAYHRLRDGFER